MGRVAGAHPSNPMSALLIAPGDHSLPCLCPGRRRPEKSPTKQQSGSPDRDPLMRHRWQLLLPWPGSSRSNPELGAPLRKTPSGTRVSGSHSWARWGTWCCALEGRSDVTYSLGAV
jgi:hypothetical protein